MANATDQDWDITNPVTATSKANEGAAEIRLVRASVADRLNKEHVTIAASGAGGQHKAGSAFAFYNADPVTNITTTLDSVALAVGDNGRLAVDSDGPWMMVYVHPAWTSLSYLKLAGGTVAGVTTYTAAPTGTGVGGGSVYINPASAAADYKLFGVALNGSERFSVDEDGDVVVAGTLDVAGVTALTGGATLPASKQIVCESSASPSITVSTTSNSGAIAISATSAGDGLEVSHNSTGNGISVTNLVAGTGILITNTGTGIAIDINHDEDTATDVVLSRIDGKNTSGAGDVVGQKIYAQTDTGDAIVFSVDASNVGGTGTEILFDFTAGAAGELAGHTKTGANAYATTTSGGGTFTCTGYIQIRDDAGALKYIPYGDIANTA